MKRLTDAELQRDERVIIMINALKQARTVLGDPHATDAECQHVAAVVDLALHPFDTGPDTQRRIPAVPEGGEKP